MQYRSHLKCDIEYFFINNYNGRRKPYSETIITNYILNKKEQTTKNTQFFFNIFHILMNKFLG